MMNSAATVTATTVKMILAAILFAAINAVTVVNAPTCSFEPTMISLRDPSLRHLDNNQDVIRIIPATIPVFETEAAATSAGASSTALVTMMIGLVSLAAFIVTAASLAYDKNKTTTTTTTTATAKPATKTTTTTTTAKAAATPEPIIVETVEEDDDDDEPVPSMMSYETDTESSDTDSDDDTVQGTPKKAKPQQQQEKKEPVPRVTSRSTWGKKKPQQQQQQRLEYQKGQQVYYIEKGLPQKATIIQVHYDVNLVPFYYIKLASNGNIIQTINKYITPPYNISQPPQSQSQQSPKQQQQKQPVYTENQKVYYIKEGLVQKAKIFKVYYDNELEPYYAIKLSSNGIIKDTVKKYIYASY